MKILKTIAIVALFCFPMFSIAADSLSKEAAMITPDADNAGIRLPQGFGALAFASDVGRARHIVVNTNGDVYIKLARAKDGKSILRLRDMNKDGKADETIGFGAYGGTGIDIKNGYLYASSNTEVYRYKLNDKNEVADTANPEIIIKGLKAGNQHETKSIALDNAGNIYVNIGAYSNSCQEQDRQNGSKGMDPCPVLNDAGGIWQFKVDKLNQSYPEGVRYATGLRNVVGLDWNQQVNELYVMQHGRDQLFQMWPKLYDQKQGAELPAEEMFLVKKGMNFGWPYCYYDPFQNKKVLAPEYGGDGKTIGRCAEMQNPVVAFPAHMAPNGLLFYTGNMFPEKYKNGAFVAFHGSWNRSPEPQKGFFVAFVPMKDGQPTGKWEIFADGFSGKEIIESNRDAKYKPCGLAQGTDGSLYITDDTKGMVWRVVYNNKK
jgi:glucose/arabinose dehydrogenase